MKISGVWSGDDRKKQRAEEALKNYSDLFKQLLNKEIDEVAFVERLGYMKSPTTDLKDLFDALQLFPAWKLVRHSFGKETSASLETIQDKKSIETIEDVIKGINISLGTDDSAVTTSLPPVSDVTTEEKDSAVSITGEDIDIG